MCIFAHFCCPIQEPKSHMRVKLNTPQSHLSIVVWSILTCGVCVWLRGCPFEQKENSISTNNKSPLVVAAVGGQSGRKISSYFSLLGSIVTQHIAQRAHWERKFALCEWLLIALFSGHPCSRAGMNAAPVNICDHMCVLSESGSIMAGDEKLKIKRCCCALWMGELCAELHERDRKDQIVFHVRLLSDVSFICNNNIRQS